MRFGSAFALCTIWNTYKHRIGKESQVTPGQAEYQEMMERLTRLAIARCPRVLPLEPSATLDEARDRLGQLVPHAMAMEAWQGGLRRPGKQLQIRAIPHDGGNDHGLTYMKAHRIVVKCNTEDERNLSVLLHEMAHVAEGDTSVDNSMSAGHGGKFMAIWHHAVCEALIEPWSPLTMTPSEIGEVERRMDAAMDVLRKRQAG